MKEKKTHIPATILFSIARLSIFCVVFYLKFSIQSILKLFFTLF